MFVFLGPLFPLSPVFHIANSYVITAHLLIARATPGPSHFYFSSLNTNFVFFPPFTRPSLSHSFSPSGLRRIYQRWQGAQRCRQGSYPHQVRGRRVHQQPHIRVRQLLQQGQGTMGVLLLPLPDEKLLLHGTGRKDCERCCEWAEY
jgi:hypothetical protein